MRKIGYVALSALTALALAACGDSEPQSGGPLTLPAETSTTAPTTTQGSVPESTQPPTSETPPPAASEVTVYLIDDHLQAVPTNRTVTSANLPAAVVEALISGPTSSESQAGLTTAFPPESLLLGVSVANGTATVDMSREFESGGGSAAILTRLAQLVYSLTEFDDIERVQLLLDGQNVDTFSGEGFVIADSLTRAEFASAVPIGEGSTASGADTWSQSDLPTVEPGSADVYRVVLVAADDFLNVRAGAGVDNEIVGRLLGGVAVGATGETSTVGSSLWMELDTPAGPGWVNGFYLTASAPSGGFPAGTDADEILNEFATRWRDGRDVTDLIARQGLWVSYHGPAMRFERNGVADLPDDPTTSRWGSPALEPNSPEITPETFREAVIEPFLSVYFDPDLSVTANHVEEGPNGRPVEFIIPTEFGGFPYLMIYDPGDNPEYGGLDWMSWVISFAYEDGELKVAGLTIDEWAP